jgi:integrase
MRKVAELYLAEAELTLSPNSIRNYQSYVKNWINPGVGSLQARELTVLACDNLIKKILADNDHDSAKSVRTVLSNICAYAVRFGAMDINPVKSVARLSRESEKEVLALTKSQRIDLIAKLEVLADTKKKDVQGRQLGVRAAVWADLPDIVRAMLATGVRLGELLALTGVDVDPNTRLVAVDYHIVRIPGHGLKRVRNRKGNASGLLLKVPAWSVPTFRQRKAAAGEGPLFPAWSGGWLDPSNVTNRIKDALRASGYDWVTSHVFRKTVATVLDEANLPTTAVADQLGNTAKVVEKHYRARRVANEATSDALESMLSDTDSP